MTTVNYDIHWSTGNHSGIECINGCDGEHKTIEEAEQHAESYLASVVEPAWGWVVNSQHFGVFKSTGSYTEKSVPNRAEKRRRSDMFVSQ